MTTTGKGIEAVVARPAETTKGDGKPADATTTEARGPRSAPGVATEAVEASVTTATKRRRGAARPASRRDVVVAADGLARPAWASTDPLLRSYYDIEWGMPVRDERGLFERLSLEAFQAGLSWATILRKRPAFREAFAGFAPDVVARFVGPTSAFALMEAVGVVDTHLVGSHRRGSSGVWATHADELPAAGAAADAGPDTQAVGVSRATDRRAR